MPRALPSLLLLLTLVLAPASALAQERGGGKEGGGPPAGPTEDGAELILKLEVAMEGKGDLDMIDKLCRRIQDFAKTSKDQIQIDTLATMLHKALKKRDMLLKLKILETLGVLQSPKSTKVLKRYAFVKAKKDDAVKLKAVAVAAIAKYRDPKNIAKLGDAMKSRDMTTARNAIKGMEHYRNAKGKHRKKIAELLMKRLAGERPSAGGQGSGNISAEQTARWNKLAPVIVSSMQAITRETTISELENWQDWWKENKNSRKVWRDKKPEDEDEEEA
jgi:hypothetical protein